VELGATQRRGYMDEDRKMKFIQFVPIFTDISLAVCDILMMAVMMWGCLLRLKRWAKCVAAEGNYVEDN
jgi:hypothetical protein